MQTAASQATAGLTLASGSLDAERTGQPPRHVTAQAANGKPLTGTWRHSPPAADKLWTSSAKFLLALRRMRSSTRQPAIPVFLPLQRYTKAAPSARLFSHAPAFARLPECNRLARDAALASARTAESRPAPSPAVLAPLRPPNFLRASSPQCASSTAARRPRMTAPRLAPPQSRRTDTTIRIMRPGSTHGPLTAP